MAYLVKLTARAERDFARLYREIDAENLEKAKKWCIGLGDAILSLGELPNRCPATPETGKLRHFLYGHKPHVYRVIYRVTERKKLVEVLHIRHGARQRFQSSDLE